MGRVPAWKFAAIWAPLIAGIGCKFGEMVEAERRAALAPDAAA